MSYPSAYLLLAHGSRDPRPQAAMDALAERFAQKIPYAGLQSLATGGEGTIVEGTIANDHSSLTTAPLATVAIECEPPLVGTAFLECHPLPLHKQIEQFSARVKSATTATNGGAKPCKIAILPLFLLPGVHVMDDIPQEMALAQQALGDAIELDLRPAIGSHPGLLRLVTECMATQPVESWIVLAHGSRRSNGNQPVEALAERLGTLTAYWSVPPSLESRLQELSQLGIRQIGILPYFLFAGGITDAIAQAVETLSQQFPTLHLHLAPPLAASSELTDLLVDLAQDEAEGKR
ncbi:MAG: sirohydrochlorin chelatase [Stenomitos frigidus ULC029]